MARILRVNKTAQPKEIATASVVSVGRNIHGAAIDIANHRVMLEPSIIKQVLLQVPALAILEIFDGDSTQVAHWLKKLDAVCDAIPMRFDDEGRFPWQKR